MEKMIQNKQTTVKGGALNASEWERREVTEEGHQILREAETLGKYTKQKNKWFPFSSKEKKRHSHEFRKHKEVWKMSGNEVRLDVNPEKNF